MKSVISVLLVLVSAGCKPDGSFDNKHVSDNPRVASSIARKQSGIKRMDEATTAERDRKECAAWNYDESRVATDLASMKPVDQEKWGRICYQYSCSYQGVMQINGREKNLTVNAGGWISITEDGRTNYLISEQQLSGFLASCNCCE